MQAIRVFEELACSDELRMDYVLQPGEIQLLSNHTVLHARDSFKDDAKDVSKRRHLLRLWLVSLKTKQNMVFSLTFPKI